MKTTIEIQDEYIAKVSRKSESDRNYEVIVSKAWKKAKAALAEIGFSPSQIDRILFDANDVARLERASR